MTVTETENEYGCVRCQAWHGESDGPIYAEHLLHQSKHGLRDRPAGGWPVPACRVCNDTGTVWSPDPDGCSVYDSACPAPIHDDEEAAA